MSAVAVCWHEGKEGLLLVRVEPPKLFTGKTFVRSPSQTKGKVLLATL